MADFYEDAAEAECVRRLHGVSRDIRAVEDYKRNLAAKRRELIRTLLDRFGWTQRGVARELGVSQAMVWKILGGKKRKEVITESDAR